MVFLSAPEVCSRAYNCEPKRNAHLHEEYICAHTRHNACTYTREWHHRKPCSCSAIFCACSHIRSGWAAVFAKPEQYNYTTWIDIEGSTHENIIAHANDVTIVRFIVLESEGRSPDSLSDRSTTKPISTASSVLTYFCYTFSSRLFPFVSLAPVLRLRAAL